MVEPIADLDSATCDRPSKQAPALHSLQLGRTMFISMTTYVTDVNRVRGRSLYAD